MAVNYKMNDADSFLIDLTDATLSRDELQNEMMECLNLRKDNKKTATIEYTMRRHITDLAMNIDSLNQTLGSYEQASISEIPPSEIKNRKGQVDALKNDLNTIE